MPAITITQAKQTEINALKTSFITSRLSVEVLQQKIDTVFLGASVEERPLIAKKLMFFLHPDKLSDEARYTGEEKNKIAVYINERQEQTDGYGNFLKYKEFLENHNRLQWILTAAIVGVLWKFSLLWTMTKMLCLLVTAVIVNEFLNSFRKDFSEDEEIEFVRLWEQTEEAMRQYGISYRYTPWLHSLEKSFWTLYVSWKSIAEEIVSKEHVIHSSDADHEHSDADHEHSDADHEHSDAEYEHSDADYEHSDAEYEHSDRVRKISIENDMGIKCRLLAIGVLHTTIVFPSMLVIGSLFSLHDVIPYTWFWAEKNLAPKPSDTADHSNQADAAPGVGRPGATYRPGNQPSSSQQPHVVPTAPGPENKPRSSLAELD